MGIRLISASWAQKVWFLPYTNHVRRILMKNYYFLADLSERMRVRLITVSWAQKRLIPTF